MHQGNNQTDLKPVGIQIIHIQILFVTNEIIQSSTCSERLFMTVLQLKKKFKECGQKSIGIWVIKNI